MVGTALGSLLGAMLGSSLGMSLAWFMALGVSLAKLLVGTLLGIELVVTTVGAMVLQPAVGLRVLGFLDGVPRLGDTLGQSLFTFISVKRFSLVGGALLSGVLLLLLLLLLLRGGNRVGGTTRARSDDGSWWLGTGCRAVEMAVALGRVLGLLLGRTEILRLGAQLLAQSIRASEHCPHTSATSVMRCWL
jgi:hypothetical protein